MFKRHAPSSIIIYKKNLNFTEIATEKYMLLELCNLSKFLKKLIFMGPKNNKI
jgi:hypothetical protein